MNTCTLSLGVCRVAWMGNSGAVSPRLGPGGELFDPLVPSAQRSDRHGSPSEHFFADYLAGPPVPDTLWGHFALSKDLAPLGVSADQGVQVSRPWTRAQTSSDWIRAWDAFSFTLSRLAGHLCPGSILQVHSLPLGDTHWWKALSQRAPSTCREAAGVGRRFSRGEAGSRRQGVPLLHFPILCALTSVFL